MSYPAVHPIPRDFTHDLEYQVWAPHQTLIEDPHLWKMVAVFQYFQEALDYREYCDKRKVPCVVRCLDTGNAYPGKIPESDWQWMDQR